MSDVDCELDLFLTVLDADYSQQMLTKFREISHHTDFLISNDLTDKGTALGEW